MAVSGSDDKTVKLWDVDAHQVMHTFYDHSEYVFLHDLQMLYQSPAYLVPFVAP